MARKIELKWFRLWAPEILGEADPDGFNAYKELSAQQHWCWVALRALCSMTEFQPVICQTPYVGYTDTQLAQAFNVPVDVWRQAKQKLELAKKIEVDGQNVIRIMAWDRFGGRYFQQRKSNDTELKIWTAEDEERKKKTSLAKAEAYKRIIEYLNTTTGKKFRIGTVASFKHFSARFDEGATEEQFRHVIDVKCAQWLGREDMEMYIRPETLFNSEKFWGYANEPAVKRRRPIGGTGSLSIMPEEQVKYEAEAKREYNERLKAAMARYGWKSEDEIPASAYMEGIPTFNEFFKMFIQKKRKSPDWSLDNEPDEKVDD
jgi:uncharacterized phage protein (TIGR02220 family)